ncbi:hypothetical protein [Bradyrhizobium sp. 15]|uniref:hypothetical protein n=1 Tax=Bradyrhizobium sp. 15 TaxID=2782633 RepID=UPI001FFA2575|nr:hypothetical protein [Bradyrhizobium sp. 15]MCK1434973.1 hypothetical protein [Bradyrhizobium sp. 15]
MVSSNGLSTCLPDKLQSLISTTIKIRSDFQTRRRQVSAGTIPVWMKSITFEQQGLASRLGERGKAVAEIQLGGMAAVFAEIAIGLARNFGLGFGHRLNRNLRFLDRFIEHRLAIGFRLASITTAASTKFAADMRRIR